MLVSLRAVKHRAHDGLLPPPPQVHCTALERPLQSAQLMASFVSDHDAMGERGYYVTVFCSALSWVVQVRTRFYRYRTV